MDTICKPFRGYIDSQARSFKIFLRSFLLKDDSDILDEIAQQTDVYVFSGVIRNFLCGIPEQRDLDIVISNVASLSLSSKIQELSFVQNSFGGWKIKINNLIVDAWGLENTWGLIKENLSPTPQNLIQTSFFNFSSIVYDYNQEKFIYDFDFLLFLATEMMDVVYPENPNVVLCIINTYHYRQKFGYGLSASLCKWIYDHKIYLSYEKCRNVQLKHFGIVLYNLTELESFIKQCFNARNKGILPVQYF